MKLSALVVGLAAVGASALNVFRVSDELRRITGDDLDVPGQNPLKFCHADRSDDLITIDEVILTPNPPQAYVASPKPPHPPKSRHKKIHSDRQGRVIARVATV